jgi:polyribonucleotide nucleotidyltransferase
MAKMNDAIVYATVCAEREVESGIDFSPLRVDYFSRFRCGFKPAMCFLRSIISF